MTEIGNDLEKAAGILIQGGLVAIPTETVYGLAGNALDDKVVSRIFEVKNRPSFNPLIIHVNGFRAIGSYVEQIPPLALKLAKEFWPGPLTLVLPKKSTISFLVTAGNEGAAFRVPRHPMTTKLLELLPFPLVAPSANPSGFLSPTTALHVAKQLGGKVDYILDGGPCSVGLESTIIGFDEKGNPLMYRQGGISEEEIESEAGIRPAPYNASVKAPGMLSSHYAPHTLVKIISKDQIRLVADGQKSGILAFDHFVDPGPGGKCLVLSPSGDLGEAARNFFGFLRNLDEEGLDQILTFEFPNKGLGRALNDRLSRAAANKTTSIP